MTKLLVSRHNNRLIDVKHERDPIGVLEDPEKFKASGRPGEFPGKFLVIKVNVSVALAQRHLGKTYIGAPPGTEEIDHVLAIKPYQLGACFG